MSLRVLNVASPGGVGHRTSTTRFGGGETVVDVFFLGGGKVTARKLNVDPEE